MIGQLGLHPILVTIASGVIDARLVADAFTSRLIVNGEGGASDDLDQILSEKQPGSIVVIQGIVGQVLTIKNLAKGGGDEDIRTPGGVDFFVVGEQNVTVIYDAVNNEWAFMDGALVGVGDVPDGTVENDHLEWDNIGKAWIAQQFFEFGSGNLPAVGDLRFKNNTIAAAFRNFANTGDIEVKVDTNDFVDITENNNGLITLRLRAQHAVNPDQSLTLTQLSGTGGAATFASPTQINLDIGATGVISITVTGVSLNDLDLTDVTNIIGRDDATPFKIIFDAAEDSDTFISDDTATADRINVTAGGVTFFSWLHDGTRPIAGIVSGANGILTISDGQFAGDARAVPPDADIDNDALNYYIDTSSDPPRAAFKRKSTVGVVTTGTYLYSPVDFDIEFTTSNTDIGSSVTPYDASFLRRLMLVSGGSLLTGSLMARNNAGDFEFNVPVAGDLYRFFWAGGNDILFTFGGTTNEIQVDTLNAQLQLTLQPTAINPAIDGIIRHVTGGDVKVFSGGVLRNMSDIGSGAPPFDDNQVIIQDNLDNTKTLTFNLSLQNPLAANLLSWAAGGSRTHTFSSTSGTIAQLNLAQTWTAEQTFNADIQLGANIDLTGNRNIEIGSDVLDIRHSDLDGLVNTRVMTGNQSVGRTSFMLDLETTGDVQTGGGPIISFRYTDSIQTNQILGEMGFVRGSGTNDSDFILKVTLNGGNVERLRIDENGVATFTGDVTLAAGKNLTLQASGAVGFMDIGEITTPGDPSANFGRLYTKDVATTHSELFYRDELGTETNLLAGSGSSFADDVFDIHDDVTPAKILQFTLAGLTSGTSLINVLTTSAVRTWSLPDITGTFALLQGTQTFSGAKTFSANLTMSAADIIMADNDVLGLNELGFTDNHQIRGLSTGIEIETSSNDSFKVIEGNSNDRILTFDNFIIGANRVSRLILEHNVAAVQSPVIMVFKNQANAASNHSIAQIFYEQDNASAVVTDFAREQVDVLDATNNGEEASWFVQVIANGSLKNVIQGDGNSSGNINLAFRGATPQSAPNYTISNPTTDRTLDVANELLDGVRETLGTLIQDLIDVGLLT